MTDNNIAIKVENLSKCYQIYDKPHQRLLQGFLGSKKQHYKEFWALKDISFEIKKGETVGIIGRNGSGKSTLLQIICGTLTPTSGTVDTYGRIAALLELGSGFNPEFTGRENVYMNAAILGLTTEEVDARYDAIAAFAEIGDFIEQPVKTYSSGMMVRLAFAVAINVDPEILIVDEALSVGDELFQHKCFARIEAIKNKGATILFVSHSTSIINQLCDEAIFIDHGNLLLSGSPRVVTKRYHQLLFAKSEHEVLADIKEERLASAPNNDDQHIKTKGDYVDGLEITPLKYQKQGGEILAFELQDKDANKVNIVPTGFSGLVKLTVRFDEMFNDAIVGCHLKSVNGLEVSGLSYPLPKDALISVVPGDIMEITWKINLLLAVGTYFFTYGVRSMSAEGFIDRVVDGMVVKVIEESNTPAFGLFNISDNGQSWLKKINKV